MGTKEKIKAIITGIIYELFTDFMGIVAVAVLPPEKSEWLKFSIGCVIGMMILGRKYPDAINNVWKIIDEMIGK